MLFHRSFKIFSNLLGKRNISVTSVLYQDVIKSDNYLDEILHEDSEYNELADNYLHIGEAHRCFIIQPFVKWGRHKLEISPDEQLDEAKALIETLPFWKVEETTSVPLETLQTKTVFKTGNLEKLRNHIRSSPNITAVFMNVGNLKTIQSKTLQENFQKPIFDRYKIVMQILKAHAISKHAKLQVALAELYFLQRKAQKGAIFNTNSPESLKLMFQCREQKLKNAIKELREQRSLLRSKRRKMEYPVVAVVGYTNAGKTCLIKALTGEENLQPKNQLFATLDVTLHSGIFPSGLKVLYVDTVGFITDIPTNLIECFVATLEDAVLADVILHVEDLSSSWYNYKREHVLKTLKDLGSKLGADNIMDKVLNVGNKSDLVDPQQFQHVLQVSAKKEIGLDNLRYRLENLILDTTNRCRITIKVPNGGKEIRWLYKNATVVNEVPDDCNSELIKAKVIITHVKLHQFKHYFI